MKKIFEQHFYDLLSLQLSGDATADDLKLLQEQLLLNPQWQFLYDQMMQPAPPLPKQLETTQQAYATHFIKMQLQGKFDEINHTATEIQYPSSPKKIIRNWIYGAAAAIIIGIIILATISKPTVPSEHEVNTLNEIVTEKGSKSNIKLPDGTKVWLNADSKLSYKENFNLKTREVTLSGEAYFDVTHDALHPFIIHTGKANIKVLGTAFNVRNYPQDKLLETTLMRGKIEVSFFDRPGEKIIMKPLEKLIIRKDSVANKTVNMNHPSIPIADRIVLTNVSYTGVDSIISETSWMDDKMVFTNQPLQKIAEELERNFDVSVTFKNYKAKNYRYTGVFNDVSLDKILQIIHLSNRKVIFKTEGKNVFIY